jgi:hypothetical protein
VGRTHGILTHFGYRQMPKASQHVALLWLFLFSLPMLLVVPRLVQSLRERAWKRSALFLMLLIAPLIAAFGIANNADCLDLECVLLYVANMLVLFVLGPRPPMLVRRLAIALLCAAVVQDVYTGQERLRVSWVGVHTFFEWDQPLVTVASGPFEHMRISQTLVAVNAQTLRAVRSNPGPYFFGPRLDMQYMNMGLPSPVGLAAWWHPGTAFDVTEMPTLLHNWQQHRFNTLVFLKGDYAYYPAQFCRMIADGYTPDDRYPGLTVYHADSSPSPAQQAGVMRACVPQP